jgi:hypothetical protein
MDSRHSSCFLFPTGMTEKEDVLVLGSSPIQTQQARKVFDTPTPIIKKTIFVVVLHFCSILIRLPQIID